MPQRLHFDEHVDLLADMYGEDQGGRVCAVIYRRPEDAPYAAHLAAIMGVPAQRDSGRQFPGNDSPMAITEDDKYPGNKAS